MRPTAPDYYRIYVHPSALSQIIERYPALAQVLSEQIMELAGNAGYQLNSVPQVEFTPAPELSTNQVTISADHLSQQQNTTAVMQPVKIPTGHTPAKNAQIIISGQTPIVLNSAIVTIGRSRQNDITLSDSYVSRTHAQIRLRFGHYTIFDTNSQGGTFVNDVRVQEHRLQTGDIIRIGHSSLVYLEDEPDSISQTGILHID
jgi:pSer/pThr/pTyr-binding forkhead associated (FHA) protein